MGGATLMPVPTPPTVTEAFAINGDKQTIPVPSQIGITPGRASFNDGFPPLTRTARSAGGIPPFGTDMNGILYMLSAHIAARQAGQFPTYDAAVSMAIGGYALGAILAKADGSGLWLNALADNTSDPDTGGANWIGWNPTSAATVSSVVAAGTTHNFPM